MRGRRRPHAKSETVCIYDNRSLHGNAGVSHFRNQKLSPFTDKTVCV